MQPPKVMIIILNWNGWQDTIECLESVYQLDYTDYEVVLVDNGSTDGSIERIREYCEGTNLVQSKYVKTTTTNKPIALLEYPRERANLGGNQDEEQRFLENHPDRRLKLIVNEDNFGFAEGNNIGIRHCLLSSKPEFVLLLNNDTIVDRGLLSELLRVAETAQDIGFVGPKIYYYELDGRRDVIRVTGCRMNMWRGKAVHIGAEEVDLGQHDSITDVDYVSGACLLARAEMITRIGVLDSRFFAYWEENDWCRRGWEAGYRTVYAPKARLWHKTHESGLGTRQLYYTTRNRLWFLRKHASRFQYMLFLLDFLALYLPFRTAVILLNHQNLDELGVFWRGSVEGTTGFDINFLS